MDGLELPVELESLLEEMGIQWPDTKEIALGESSGPYGEFVAHGLIANLSASASVRRMLATNTSDGLAAFETHAATVVGPVGHMARAVAVDAATGLGIGEAAAAVLEYKIFVLETLGAVAAEGVAAAALALETAGASLVASAELVAEEAAVVYEAEAALIASLEGIGATASKVAGEVLTGAVKRLQNREIHRSKDGVTSYSTPDERQSIADEYQRRWEELTHDADHNGAVSDKSRREATVTIGLERAGRFAPGSVSRVDTPGSGDFQVAGPGGSVQAWDIKAMPSYDPQGKIPPWECYSEARLEELVQEQLAKGRNVVLDTQNLTREDLASLVATIRRNPEWADRVVIY